MDLAFSFVGFVSGPDSDFYQCASIIFTVLQLYAMLVKFVLGFGLEVLSCSYFIKFKDACAKLKNDVALLVCLGDGRIA